MVSKLSLLETFIETAHGIYIQINDSKYIYYDSCDSNCMYFSCIYGNHTYKGFRILRGHSDLFKLRDCNNDATSYARFL